MAPSNDSLMELVAAVRGGDRGALGPVFEKILPAVEAFVRLHSGAKIRQRESIGDLVQTICREVIDDLPKFDGEAELQFSKWLYAVARNKIQSKGRFHGAAKRDPDREVARQDMSASHTVSAPEHLLGHYASFCTPSRNVGSAEQVALIEAAFDSLPEEYRQVITLSCFLGLSHAEVAREMGRSEASARKLLSRARARLAMRLSRDHDKA